MSAASTNMIVSMMIGYLNCHDQDFSSTGCQKNAPSECFAQTAAEIIHSK